ncbi:MAG: hypothetical protein HUU20_14960 [Pirellulales bacterium]|nr:hypothetical protein [Pirellulales bacterium]
MSASTPAYILFSDAVDGPGDGRWRFVLRSTGGVEQVEADELEPGVCGERLELLAVVRGLEALDQPSRVTLVTSSAYVREGIRHGLVEWRKNGWCWEFFGQMVPVKNRDLWRRVDRALAFHSVECRGRNWRFDPPHLTKPVAEAAPEDRDEVANPALAPSCPDGGFSPAYPQNWRQRILQQWRKWRRRVGDSLSGLAACPRFG